MQAHEIEYKIYGDYMQTVSIILDPHEAVIAESGAMMLMNKGIQKLELFYGKKRLKLNL